MKFTQTFLGLLAGMLLSGAAMADTFAVTYGVARIEGPNVGALCTGSVTCVVGTQKFTGAFSGTTDYGTAGGITGAYAGDYGLVNAGQYGGALGVGDYIATFSPTGYTITLGHDASLPGVNYFGFWLSALDSGNELKAMRGGSVVGTYTPADLRAAVNSQSA
jgi:hypothetical protein